MQGIAKDIVFLSLTTSSLNHILPKAISCLPNVLPLLTFFFILLIFLNVAARKKNIVKTNDFRHLA